MGEGGAISGGEPRTDYWLRPAVYDLDWEKRMPSTKLMKEKRGMEISTSLIGAQLHRLFGGHSRLPDAELVFPSRSQTNDIGLVRIDSVVTNVIPGRFDSIQALAPFQ
jgi:hypothetical protein